MPTIFSGGAQPNAPEDYSLGGFGKNVISDVGGIAKGIVGIPKLGYDVIKNPVIAKDILSGIGRHVQELVSHPIETFYQHPVGTALDVAPIAGALTKGGLAARLLGRTEIVSTEAAVEAAQATGVAARLKRLVSTRKITQMQADAEDLVRTRYANVGKAYVDARQFYNKFTKDVPEGARSDITFYIQKTRNPLVDAKGVGAGAVEERLRSIPGALGWAEKVSNRLEDFRKAANASGLSDQIAFRENYISQFWRVPKGQVKRIAAQAFATHNPFSNPRSFQNFLQGMSAGYEPLTTDAAQLMRMYEAMTTKVIENNRLVRSLQNLKVAGPDGEVSTAIAHASEAPAGYVTVDFPALRVPFRSIKTLEGVADDLKLPFARTSGRGEKIIGFTHIPEEVKYLEFSEAPVKTVTESVAPVRVHPDLVPLLKSVFEAPMEGGLARKVTTINAWMKSASLSLSFFHHLALTESAFAALGLKGLSFGAKSGFRAGLKLIEDASFSKQAAEAGLVLGPISDVQVGIVNRGLMGAEAALRNTPILGKVATGVRKFKDVWDKTLWDYYHTGLKSYAFHTLLEKALLKNPLADAKLLARDVASFVNDAFGGQSWDLMFKSAKWRQAMHWAFLAPDWTISNLRIALRPFDSNPVIRQMGQAYWIRSALAGLGSAAMANYAITKWEDGQGRWIWDNEPGHKLDIQLPGRDSRGRRQYIKLGKQMREPLRWISEPLQIFGAKLSPAIQIAVEQITGTSTTGFTQSYKDIPVYEGLGERAAGVAQKFVPFAVRGNNFGFSLPKSAGTTGFKVVEGLKRAIKNKDNRAIVEWMRAAANNGYNARMLLSLAKRDLRAEAKAELRKASYK